METMEYDVAQARAYILERFTEQGDFAQIVSPEELARMVDDLMQLDEAYIKSSGAGDGGVYDDDAAYESIQSQMALRYPEHKMYMMRLTEDYMDYNEQYLESIGAIEWE